MIIRKVLGLSILLLAGAAAFAQTRPLPVDAAGRPVRDQAGLPLEYDTAPPGNLLVAPATSLSQAEAAAKVLPGAARKLAAGTPDYDEVWRTKALGHGIGARGIWSADLDSDGDNDFVVDGDNAYWSIVSHDGAGGYEITWQSPRYDLASITAMHLVEAGNARRIWIGLSDGHIDVVDGATHELVAVFADTFEPISDFAVADADNDGTLDVLAATNSELLLYAAATPGFTRAYPYGGEKLAVGNVDADAPLEVVTNLGQVLEISGTDVVQQWTTTMFGARVDLGDIDGDGMAELVGAEAWTTIRAWDVDLQSTKWSITADHDIAALRLIDVTGDTVPEVVYGDGQWGAVHAIDAASQTELWSAPNPEHGVTDVAVDDADGDGEPELLWAAGWTSSGPDYLYVYDIATQSVEWQSADFSGPYQAVDVGDVDADGEAELVVASWQSDSGYGDGLVMVFDAATHELEWRSDTRLFGGAAWEGVHALELVNVDADAQLEIAVGTDETYDGALYVIDGVTHDVQSSALYDSGNPLFVLDSGDLTGDGVPEVVAGNSVSHTGSPGLFLYALDPRDGALIWRSAALPAPIFAQVTDIAVADVGLPGIDIIAAASNTTVHAVRWSDKRHLNAGGDYRSVAAGDVIGTLEQEILAGRGDGSVDVLDGETLSLLSSYAVCAEPVTALEMQAVGRFLATCGETLAVYDVGTATVLDVATSYASTLGRNGSLVTGVVNGRAVVLTGGNEAVKFVDLSTNQIPVLSPASATLHWRGETDLDLGATDGDADPLTFELVAQPMLGTVVWLDRTSGELRYTSNRTGKGSDQFEVRVSDGFHYSASQMIEVLLENTPPVANSPAIELHWRGEQTASLGASDPDGDSLSFALVTGPAQGDAAIDAASGALTYTPSGAYVGPDSLSYTVTDGADTATETVALVLTNTSPAASSREFDVSGAVIASRFPAEDVDDDPLTYAVLVEPTQGELTFEPDTGLFEYTPDPNGSGTDSLQYEASDGVAQTQGTIEFQYASSPPPGNTDDGGGSGGGSAGWLLVLLAAPMLAGRRRT